MNGYNRVILMGTVGADAEVKALEGGNSVANMSIAVNESYVDKNNVRQTKVQWFKVEAWKGLANFMGNYCKKGTALLVEGRLKTETYEKDGHTMYSTKVIANSIDFAGNKSTPAAQVAESAAPVAQAPVAQAPVAQATQQTEQYVTNDQFVSGMGNGQDDDLPF